MPQGTWLGLRGEHVGEGFPGEAMFELKLGRRGGGKEARSCAQACSRVRWPG